MFQPSGDFCGACGSILAPPSEGVQNFVQCAICSTKWPFKVRDGQLLSRYERNYQNTTEKAGGGEAEEEEDVTVEHQCPKCESTTATYTTQQTRSADEGQTIFYQCVKCKYRCIEYS